MTIERQVAVLKWFVIALAAGVVGMAYMLVSYTAPPRDTVTATRFVLVDDDGNTLAELGRTETGYGLTVHGEQGTAFIGIESQDNPTVRTSSVSSTAGMFSSQSISSLYVGHPSDLTRPRAALAFEEEGVRLLLGLPASMRVSLWVRDSEDLPGIAIEKRGSSGIIGDLPPLVTIWKAP